VDVVAGAERTAAEISLKDFAGPGVVIALDRLRRILTGFKSGVAPTLVARVDQLLVTIQKAKLVAQLGGTTKSLPIGSPGPHAEPRTATATAEASSAMPPPYPVPTVLAPKGS
jgi:hypothetical protein